MAAMVKLIKEQSVFKKDEMLYISKSRELQRLLHALNLDVLYDPILSAGKKSAFLDPNLANTRRLAEVQKLKIAYCVDSRKESLDEYNALIEGVSNTRVRARELVVFPFITQYKSESGNAAGPKMKAEELQPGDPIIESSSLADDMRMLQ